MDGGDSVKVLLAFAALLAGCSPPPSNIEILCECFSQAAYEAVKRPPAPAPPPAACCKDCRGTGKVRSGDGQALVDCPCPETCKCKKK